MFKGILILAMLFVLITTEFPDHDMTPLLLMSGLAIGLDLLFNLFSK